MRWIVGLAAGLTGAYLVVKGVEKLGSPWMWWRP
jgi:hypothetical protein